MREIIHSVGIDIGTSTTQLIFSKIIIENLASSYTVPRITIVDKEVIYKSEIYFTPLLSPTEIDIEKIRKIVMSEYEKAKITIDMLKTGAVIITGETARKKNAKLVVDSLSDLAGDFVVATAGPDLESVLSARGAGVDIMSKDLSCKVANIDIGGGTSNIAIYENGNLKSVACLDIGGRLIKIDKDTLKVTYIYSKLKEEINKKNINIKIDEIIRLEEVQKVCDIMADILCQSLFLKDRMLDFNNFFTNSNVSLKDYIEVDAITFSGGVADYVYNENDGDWFKYGDIGIILGDSIRKSALYNNVKILKSKETISATVVGAGTHTTEISGSTIFYAEGKLPIKNIPILRINEEEEFDNQKFINSIKTQINL
ncbi:MAG: ethanolamine ammonia-lyase reactivating factor EutA, partial [Oscillospiraceae bacterium]